MEMAPIILFVYKRPWHTQQTVESLKKNILSDASELYIFSDGPKNELDYDKVEKVRTFINTIDGFKKVTIHKSEKNKGLANSVIEGVTQVINEYGKAIVLEDDLVSSPGFLKYMNEGLEFYKDNFKVFSITGYCHPIEMPKDYRTDIFFSNRASSWGWGTWIDRWNMAKWNKKDFYEFISSKKIQTKFNFGGEDLSSMLKAQFYGNIDSWAIKWSYSHFLSGAFCVYPVKSLIKHLGADKTGTHFSSTKKYDVHLFNSIEDITFSIKAETNDEIMEQINNLVKPSIVRKIINFIKYDLFMKLKK